MFSLQKLLGKDDKFFRLMEASADEARASIQNLRDIYKAPEGKRNLAAVIETRRKEKRVTQELTEHLLKTFVTPLEREDIEQNGLGRRNQRPTADALNHPATDQHLQRMGVAAKERGNREEDDRSDDRKGGVIFRCG